MARPTPSDLLRTGSLAAMGLALTEGSAAEARSTGLREQADALRAAAASRQSAAQPAALSPDQQYDQARALLAANDTAGAMAAFRRVLVHDPQSVDAMNGLGITYDRMGRHDIARGWYEAALAIDPHAPSVLANLGYSLLLADQPRAAIPWLQSAAASPDARAAATARRLLSQISARLTAEAAAAPLAPRAAEIALVTTPVTSPATTPATTLATATASAPSADSAPPVVATFAPPSQATPTSARIELAANGEARLVLGSAAPAPALVEALGEAATLVLVATPWSEREEAPLRPARDAPVQLALVRPMVELVMAPAPALRLERPLTASMVLAAAPADPGPARRPDAAPPVQLAAAPPLRDFASVAPTAPQMRAAPVLRAAPALPDPATGWRRAGEPDLAPAWLITTRRSAPQNAPAPGSPATFTDAPASVPAFDSDDETLNLFAARHRAVPDTDSPAARQAAIARLEALIARARQA